MSTHRLMRFKTPTQLQHGNPTWRKRQIILEPVLVERLFNWHGGQDSYVYSLASSGMRDLVSLSMIDAAITELGQALRKVKARGDRRDLEATISGLEGTRQFWHEHSAQEAGMSLSENEYEYDARDYGMDPDEEKEISVE